MTYPPPRVFVELMKHKYVEKCLRMNYFRADVRGGMIHCNKSQNHDKVI